MERGKFIVLEGIDGCGKTTQAELLANEYKKYNKPVVTMSNTIESSPINNAIRALLNVENGYKLSNAQMASLFIAELYITADIVEKHLSSGTTVICSRWSYSTLAYAGVDDELYQAINLMYKDLTIKPDYVFYLDITADEAKNRIDSRNGIVEHYDDIEKLRIIRDRYEKVMLEHSDVVIIYNVNAALPKLDITENILTTLIANDNLDVASKIYIDKLLELN